MAALAAFGGGGRRVPQGQLTQTIYGWIRDSRFEDAAEALAAELQFLPDNRAALSLLAYCQYQAGQFEEAAATYEQLTRVCPDNDAYRLHLAQALHKAGAHAEAARAAQRVKAPQHAAAVATLLAAGAYEAGDLPACRRALARAAEAGADAGAVATNTGCLLYKEGDLEGARAAFADALAALGPRPQPQYNAAVVAYKQRRFGDALTLLAQIVERGVREHPELGVGSSSSSSSQQQQHEEGAAASAAAAAVAGPRSVGNSAALKETALVEAFNLKAAVELSLRDARAAAEALADMPPRAEAELDPVTLHNLALAHMDDDPGGGFRKLNHLLSLAHGGGDGGGGGGGWGGGSGGGGFGHHQQQLQLHSGACPPETFANLLLLYVAPQHGFYDLAADVLAENPRLAAAALDRDLLELLQCLVAARGGGAGGGVGGIGGSAQPEAALAQLDALAARHVQGLRALTKAIQDARLARDGAAIQAAIQRYDDALERYVPVLMAMGAVFWDRRAYAALEALLRQAGEFCGEHDAWRLNLAHALFAQECRYADAVRQYQPLVARAGARLLSLPAVVLANLCVAYIMTSQNEEAEELMRAVEREEEEEAAAATAAPSADDAAAHRRGRPRPSLHLAVINLVIGTLYCAKGNHEFGVGRVVKALEPLPARLSPDTWCYAKRCLLALADALSKHMLVLGDDAWDELLGFLADVRVAGRGMPAGGGGAGVGGARGAAAAGAAAGGGGGGSSTVAAEAQALSGVLLKLRHMA